MRIRLTARALVPLMALSGGATLAGEAPVGVAGVATLAAVEPSPEVGGGGGGGGKSHVHTSITAIDRPTAVRRRRVSEGS